MELELFTVYMKKDGTVKLEVNEQIIKAYGITLEEFENKFDEENLLRGIKDVIDSIRIK